MKDWAVRPFGIDICPTAPAASVYEVGMCVPVLDGLCEQVDGDATPRGAARQLRLQTLHLHPSYIDKSIRTNLRTNPSMHITEAVLALLYLAAFDPPLPFSYNPPLN